MHAINLFSCATFACWFYSLLLFVCLTVFLFCFLEFLLFGNLVCIPSLFCSFLFLICSFIRGFFLLLIKYHISFFLSFSPSCVPLFVHSLARSFFLSMLQSFFLSFLLPFFIPSMKRLTIFSLLLYFVRFFFICLLFLPFVYFSRISFHLISFQDSNTFPPSDGVRDENIEMPPKFTRFLLKTIPLYTISNSLAFKGERDGRDVGWRVRGGDEDVYRKCLWTVSLRACADHVWSPVTWPEAVHSLVIRTEAIRVISKAWCWSLAALHRQSVTAPFISSSSPKAVRFVAGCHISNTWPTAFLPKLFLHPALFFQTQTLCLSLIYFLHSLLSPSLFL